MYSYENVRIFTDSKILLETRMLAIQNSKFNCNISDTILLKYSKMSQNVTSNLSILAKDFK